MKVLITGSEGFVSRAVGDAAVRAGDEVIGIVRPEAAAASGERACVSVALNDARLVDVLRELRPEVIFHGAGKASVAESLRAPLNDLEGALGTFASVLDATRRAQIQPVVLFPSSAAVYGNPATLPVREDAPTRPISPYGFHKAACELLAAEYATCFGLPVIVCRLFSLYGPGQRRLLVWELFQKLSSREPEVTLEGTGHESRDYLHVDDAANAMLSLARARHAASGGPPLTTVNVATGSETAIRDLADLMRALVDPSKEISFRGHARPGDPTRWCADVTTLSEVLPHSAPRGLRDGLGECIRVWSSNRDSRRPERNGAKRLA